MKNGIKTSGLSLLGEKEVHNYYFSNLPPLSPPTIGISISVNFFGGREFPFQSGSDAKGSTPEHLSFVGSCKGMLFSFQTLAHINFFFSKQFFHFQRW